MADLDFSNTRAIVMDIEGTTTSISFVKDTLFPYVRTNLANFLAKNWDSESLLADIKLLKEQYVLDKEAAMEGLVAIDDNDKESLEKNILWQMDLDRKTTALKQLQGHIWADGYANGDLKGHIFEDVAESLKKWASDGRRLFIYSSGSIEAQKLLFANTTAGSFLDIINGHYDTTTGAKQASESYSAIAKDIGCPPEEIIFLTDVVAEAEAALEAGFRAILVERQGNAPISDTAKSNFTVISSFDELVFEPCSKRAKRDITEPQKEDAAEAMDVDVLNVETDTKTELSSGEADKLPVDACNGEDPLKPSEENIVTEDLENLKKIDDTAEPEKVKDTQEDETKPNQNLETVRDVVSEEESKILGEGTDVEMSEESPAEAPKAVTHDTVEHEVKSLGEVNQTEGVEKSTVEEKSTEPMEEKSNDESHKSESDVAKVEEPSSQEKDETELTLNEQNIAVDEQKLVVVDQQKPVVVEDQNPAVVDEQKPAIVDEQKSVVVDGQKSAVVDEPKSIVVDEQKPDGDELKPAVVVDETPQEEGDPGVTNETEINEHEKEIETEKEEVTKNGSVNGINAEKPTNGTNGTDGVADSKEIAVKKIAEGAPVEVAVAAE